MFMIRLVNICIYKFVCRCVLIYEFIRIFESVLRLIYIFLFIFLFIFIFISMFIFVFIRICLYTVQCFCLCLVFSFVRISISDIEFGLTCEIACILKFTCNLHVCLRVYVYS